MCSIRFKCEHGNVSVDAATRERAGKGGGRPYSRCEGRCRASTRRCAGSVSAPSGHPRLNFFLGRGIPTYGCDLDPIALGRLSPRLTGRANALSTFGVSLWAVPPSVLIPAPEGPNGRESKERLS